MGRLSSITDPRWGIFLLLLALSACSPQEKEQNAPETSTQRSALVGDGSPLITYSILQEGETNLLESGAKLSLAFLANGNGGNVTSANAGLKGSDNQDIELANVVPGGVSTLQPVNQCSNARHCVDNQLDLSTLEGTLYSLVLTVENSAGQRTVKEYPIRLQGVSEDIDQWKSAFADLEGIDPAAQERLDRATEKLNLAKAASETGNLGNVLLASEDAINDLVAATGTTSAVSLPQAATTLDHLITRLQGRLNAYKSDQPEQESFATAQGYIDDARTIHQTAPPTLQELQAGFLTLANAFFWMEEGANPTVVENYRESRDVIRRLMEEMRQYNSTTLPGRSDVQGAVDALTPVEAFIDRVVRNGDTSLSDQEHVELLLGLTNTAESIKKAENTSAWVRNWQWGLTQITYVYASRALRNAATFFPPSNPVIAEGFSTLESAETYREDFRADDFMKLLIDSRCLTLSIYNFVYEPDIEPPRACCEIIDRFHQLDSRFPVPNAEGEACENVECFNDRECPAEDLTEWDTCGGFEDACDEEGTQNRTRTTYACEDFYCVSTVATETQACARDTDGDSCNDGTFCNGDDTCASGTCSTHAGNPCNANEVCDDSEDGCFECVADTDCDPESVTDWGACTDFDNACDEGGTQYRTRTAYACVNFACVATDTQEDQACTRDTDNNACDDGTFCNGADTCANGTCSVHDEAPCPNGDIPVCDENNTACVECLAATDCPETSVTDWGACGGFDDVCDNTGTQTRQRTTYACTGTSCEATVTTETQACTRDTNGTTCDDGNFCNGADTCNEGTCSNSAGDPCAGDETCDEDADLCVECLATSDCPDDLLDNWGTCGSFDNACDESGTQDRTRTSYTCVNKTCVAAESTDTQACTRDTDGTSCDDGTFCNGADTCSNGVCSVNAGDPCPGDKTCDESSDLCVECLTTADCPDDTFENWGTCGGFDNACDESGSQTRQRTSYSCVTQLCVPNTFTETQSCNRDTDGASCDDGTFCNGSDTCTGGACTTHNNDACNGDEICVEATDNCIECLADTDCPDDLIPSWGTCGGFDNACDESGTQNRTVTSYACVANSCVATDTPQTQACARNTDGDSCNDGTFCNGTDTCSGGSCSVNAGSPCVGNQTCDEAADECLGCITDSDCSDDTFSAWGTCGGFDNTCDETGTQDRTRTSYACIANTCVASDNTETQVCARNTDGTSCSDGAYCNGNDTCNNGSCSAHTGDPCGANEVCDEAGDECVSCLSDSDCPGDSVTAYGACGGFSNSCDESGSQSRTRTSYTCVANSCVASDSTENRSCNRNTDGTSCNDGAYCNGNDTCSNGSCSAHTGDPCGANQVCDEANNECVSCLSDSDCPGDSYTSYSACGGFSNSCDESGTQSRTKTSYACVANSCVATDTPQSRSCNRNTDGTSCSDGAFCNGNDTCNNGTCSNHAGNPCSGGEVCDETNNECVACLTNSDCPGTAYGSWGSCGGFGDTCDESGSRSRSVTTYACVANACVPSTTSQSQSCGRDTDGTTCGAGTSYSSWGSCGNYSGTCDESGSQSRTRTNYACSNGTCSGTNTTESRSCNRDTDGTSCGSDSVTSYGSCGGYSNTCDETGTQSRTRTRYRCAGGSCSSSASSESRVCSRDTDGDNCSGSTYSSWSACSGYSNTCDNTGTQTRTRTDYDCTNGSCGVARTVTESRSCSRNTNGTSCGSDSYSGWSSCSGYGNSCDESGSQSRTRTTYTCGSGSCQASTTTQVQTCYRDTDGNTCASSSYSGWGSCGGYSNVCDNSGSQSRTRTDYRCTNGTCGGSIATETQSCSRNTNGTSCGSTGYGSWGSCGGYSNTCDESGTRSRSVTTYSCSSGSCRSSSSSQSQSCSRDTDGTSCGSDSYSSWGSCGGYSNSCDQTGTQSRTRTQYRCGNGSCGSSNSTQTQSCSRNTNGSSCSDGTFCNGSDYCSNGSCGGHSGNPCGGDICLESSDRCVECTSNSHCPSTSYGSWSACTGFSNTCDQTGTQTRSKTTWSCSSNSCRSSTTTESRSCTRSTNGVTCGSSNTGSWSSCSGYSSQCDNTGTRSRSIQPRICSNGSCTLGSSTTETQSCSRNTNGNWCTNWQRCANGTCNGGTCSADSAPGCSGVNRYCCEPGICINKIQFCP